MHGSGIAPSRRTALVTGGTGGIGRAVAVELARRGDRVLIVGRDPGRGDAVLAALEDAGPGGGHALVRADLALLRETARAADEVTGLTDRLDAVVLCAGVLAAVAEWTDENLERGLALNYLSRYLMVRRLLPQLIAAPSGRVVLVANAGKYRDTLDLDDPHLRRGRNRGLHVSGRTQFANDLFAVELAERVRDSRIEVTCVFPGLVATDVFRNARGLPRSVRAPAVAAQRLIAAAPATSARTPAFLAHDPAATGVSGAFYGPRRRRRRVPGRVSRPDRRAALWSVSEDLVRPWLPDARPAGVAAGPPPPADRQPAAAETRNA
ncbi:SDR family NAD(P)-dependent oxidoreductase [Frankia sp. CNm7]|uniref:SDR family NAD(P)-dependent oxidoreductase n=1 Tax=Frankia nepalensis TaxID=1836974 RepID=A0A937RIN0_9ACTN|nr:SDR family NAD(P)-dependent oxidoreductase [Frankia nepalensis]MBL7495830.1 SDR family NAD(P)-dependent oxidoreductase [Frankia nepalensis]MBL7509906.1 SDR family NAD(P)-dependent oxidoreductase [Frankia nepalensis]MBL7521078.1 SDR family NAD(P)-dependent oxidoreductase [Frankia nepalensis]MBL7629665.1 SDR family NAD(P)-dependent oxidoreductase [Frankia nepalensis]